MGRSMLRVLALAGVASALAACGGTYQGAPESTTTTLAAAPVAAQPAPTTAQAPVGVTVVELDLIDPSRPTNEAPGVPFSPSRALPTTVYLPAEATAAPLVLLAHGAGGSPGRFTMLATYWAERGFVVAAPRFPATSDLVAEPVLADFPEQARDVRFVIDEVLARSAATGTPISGRVDPEHIGLFGLSLGSLTVWSEVLGDPVDERIDALVQSDGLTFVAPERVGEIWFPVLVAHSDVDSVFAFSDVTAAYDQLPGEKYFLTLHGAGHATVAEDTVTPADATYQETTTVFWRRTLRGQVDEPFPAPVPGVTSFVAGARSLPGTG
jgi:predicted dienelactone hydrolase